MNAATWTLVIFMKLGYAGGAHSIDGFSTEQACRDAINEITSSGMTDGWKKPHVSLKLCIPVK